MQIIVLGMRSGSSVITRIVNLFGINVGPEERLMAATRENPKGYWERQDVLHINNALLSRQGCTWNRVSSFDASALNEKDCAPQKQAAETVIRELDTCRPWVLKDPRICVLLPFWRPLLENPLFVFIHRNPLEVAHSLQTHHGMPLSCGLALWEKYTLDALRATLGEKRLIISYNRLMASPADTSRRMHDQLCGFGVSELTFCQDDILDFLDPSLYREKVSDPEEESLMSARQKSLHAAMESEDALSWESVPPLPLASRELLSVFDMAHRAQSAEKGLRSKVGELEKSLSSQNADMSRLKELTAILREWTGLVEESRWYQAPQCLARLRVLCAKAAALDIDKNA